MSELNDNARVKRNLCVRACAPAPAQQAWTNYIVREVSGLVFNAVHWKGEVMKAELSGSCFAFVLFGKKNDLQAKENKSEIA